MNILNYYTQLFTASYFVLIIPTILVVISGVMSAQSMGGTLGQGIKKIVVGSIVDTILITTYLLLQNGYQGILNNYEIGLFFLFSGLFASVLLISGYVQIYRISNKLKLFTP
jgi:hypothetical protein